MIRAWATLPNVDMHVAWHLFYETAERLQWDRVFSDMFIVRQQQGSDILYSSLRVPGVTTRDYLQWRRTILQEDGSIVIALRSAVHSDCPEKSGFIRAESFISGYVFRQVIEDGQPTLKLFLMTSTDIKGLIPKWIINFVAPRKPGEWVDGLARAALDFQTSHPNAAEWIKEKLKKQAAEDDYDFEFEEVTEGAEQATSRSETTLKGLELPGVTSRKEWTKSKIVL